MKHIDIDESFNKIRDILYGNCKTTKEIMKNILKKYPINMDNLIKETVKNLNNETSLYWESLIKTKFYVRTVTRVDPRASISNYHFLRDPNYTDEYDVDVYGNKTSKAIRCANYDTYFIITQNLNGDTPKNIKTINNNNYNNINIIDFFELNILQEGKEDISSLGNISSPFSYYDFDKDISKESTDSISELFTTIFQQTFKSMYKNIINEIMEEYLREINKELENKNDILFRLNCDLDQTNKSLEENNDYLEETNFPGIDDFNNFVGSFRYNDNKSKKYSLPDIERVNEKIKDFEEQKNNLMKDKEFSNFSLSTNEKGEEGWYWFLDFYCEDPYKYHFRGDGNYFVKVKTGIHELISKIKDIIKKIEVNYVKDPKYKEEYYVSTDFNKDLPRLYFRTYEAGNLEIIYDGKKISIDELNNIFEELKKLAEDISKYEANVDINDPDIINFMLNKIECWYNSTDEDSDELLSKKMKEKKYWNNRSYQYSSFKFDGCKYWIMSIINTLESIIESANNNKEKAEYFQDYSKRCIELFNGYNKYLSNNSLTTKREELVKMIDSIEEEIENMYASSNSITSIKSIALQKKRD